MISVSPMCALFGALFGACKLTLSLVFLSCQPNGSYLNNTWWGCVNTEISTKLDQVSRDMLIIALAGLH